MLIKQDPCLYFECNFYLLEADADGRLRKNLYSQVICFVLINEFDKFPKLDDRCQKDKTQHTHMYTHEQRNTLALHCQFTKITYCLIIIRHNHANTVLLIKSTLISSEKEMELPNVNVSIISHFLSISIHEKGYVNQLIMAYVISPD